MKMSGIRMQYDYEFKKNAVKLSYASPKTVMPIRCFKSYKELSNNNLRKF